MPKKKIKKKKRRIRQLKKFEIDQILLYSRQLFLFGVVNEKTSKELVKQLIALDNINHTPILLWINSPGGHVNDGFSIIDTFKAIMSPVITIINGEACSMAGLIAIAGAKRLMTEHSVFMVHDMTSGVIDYATKIECRANFIKSYQKLLFDFLRKRTKLSETELTKARNGELWLYPEDCKAKGIIDTIVK